MNEQMYLLDNNVLSHLKRGAVDPQYIADHCRVPSEVRYESSGSGIPSLEEIEYATTAGVLRQLVKLLADVDNDDRTLIDLYANKGAADPLIVACAMDAIEQDANVLFAPDWVVVSNDQAVLGLAARFGVSTMTRETFLAEAPRG